MTLPRSSGARWKAPLVFGLLIVGVAAGAWTRRPNEPSRVASVPSAVAPVTVVAAPEPVVANETQATSPGARVRAAEHRVARAPEPAQTPVAQAAPVAAPASGGWVVAIDPETGMPGMATPEQVRELMGPGIETSRTEENLLQINHPNGATGIVLDERYHEYVFVRVAPNGKKSFACVHADGYRHEVVADVVPAAAPAPAALEVE